MRHEGSTLIRFPDQEPQSREDVSEIVDAVKRIVTTVASDRFETPYPFEIPLEGASDEFGGRLDDAAGIFKGETVTDGLIPNIEEATTEIISDVAGNDQYSDNFGSDFSTTVKDLIFPGELHHDNHYDNNLPYIILVVVLAVLIIATIIALVVYHKRKNNSSKDLAGVTIIGRSFNDTEVEEVKGENKTKSTKK